MRFGLDKFVCSKQFFGGFLFGVLFALLFGETRKCLNLTSRVYEVFGIRTDNTQTQLSLDIRKTQCPNEGLRMLDAKQRNIAGKDQQSSDTVKASIDRPTTGIAEGIRKDDTRVADLLAGKVRILCWVMTQPKSLETRARHIQVTWGRKCDKLLFFSSVTNTTFPTIGVNTTEGRNMLTQKTMKAFKYVYDHYLDDYDWFMRADDDTYVVMENLRYLLSEQDPNGDLYFGRHLKKLVPGGYFSGGPGIIIGKEALKRLGKHINDPKICPQKKGSDDDVFIGDCMYNLGISIGNTTDLLGKTRFHCIKLSDHMQGKYDQWFLDNDTNWARWGMSSFSRHPIGFHYVTRDQFYEIEYFLYHAKPYGLNMVDQDVNLPRSRSKAQLPV